MAKRQGETPQQLRRRGLIPAHEVVETMRAEGMSITERTLWYLYKAGMIKPPERRAGFDALRRRVAWYPRSVLGDLRKSHKARAHQLERQGAITWLNTLPENERHQFMMDVLATRGKKLSRAGQPETGVRSVPEADRKIIENLYRQHQASYRDTAGQPVSEEEVVAEAVAKLSPAVVAAFALFPPPSPEDLARWKDPGVLLAARSLAYFDEIRLALLRNDTPTALFIALGCAEASDLTIAALAATVGLEDREAMMSPVRASWASVKGAVAPTAESVTKE